MVYSPPPLAKKWRRNKIIIMYLTALPREYEPVAVRIPAVLSA